MHARWIEFLKFFKKVILIGSLGFSWFKGLRWLIIYFVVVLSLFSTTHLVSHLLLPLLLRKAWLALLWDCHRLSLWSQIFLMLLPFYHLRGLILLLLKLPASLQMYHGSFAMDNLFSPQNNSQIFFYWLSKNHQLKQPSYFQGKLVLLSSLEEISLLARSLALNW